MVAPLTMEVIVCRYRISSEAYLFEPHGIFDGFIRPGIMTLVDGTCHTLLTNPNNGYITRLWVVQRLRLSKTIAISRL